MRSQAIFLAFAGEEIEQAAAVVEIADGFQCWNLRQFDRETFLAALQRAIPPVNTNILRHYRAEVGEGDLGITERNLQRCSWGLLIPAAPGSGGMMGYAETLFLLNLYSPTFLYPLFCGSDFGIWTTSYGRSARLSHWQNQCAVFRRREFVSFFQMLVPQAQYGAWELYRVQQWDPEDWRLFAASLLFSGLSEYSFGQSAFAWQRESADMAGILESLFTAGDTQNEEIGYRLRKRVAVLLSERFPAIEGQIKKLYKERSAFVHGSFFAQLAKESKNAEFNIPIPDFHFLHEQRECVRWALVGYLRLAQLVNAKPADYGDKTRVIDVLEAAIIDVELRKRVTDGVRSIFELLPEPRYQVQDL